MTSSPNIDPYDAQQIADSICFFCGRWISRHELRIDPDDLGFRQGVTVVERLRTYRGRAFEVARHAKRWRHSKQVMGLPASDMDDQWESLIAELVDRNRRLVDDLGDVGITLFTTPGKDSTKVNDPASNTFAAHLNLLDVPRYAKLRVDGQPLVMTHVHQPAENVWPRTAKLRARPHYFLADRTARASNPQALGVLLDDDGTITETSVANLAIVSSGSIVSPPQGRVLDGVTQSVAEELCDEIGIEWERRSIPIDEFCQAESILMFGTGPGVWFASSVDGNTIGDGSGGTIYRKLREAFDQRTLAS